MLRVLAWGHAGMLYACKGAHTLFTGQRDRERKRESERKREGEREREQEIKRVRDKERER